MAWRMAQSLGGMKSEGLLGEINESAPERSTSSDGGIGDASHSSRTSDHNPCSCHRVVCARDFTHDPDGGFDANTFAMWLGERSKRIEPRVRYIIWNRKICSGQKQSYPAGVWRPYGGSNPHTKHVHVSLRHGPEQFDNTEAWGWTIGYKPPKPKPTELAEPAWSVPSALPATPPEFPLPAGHWFGPMSPDDRNHSGYYARDKKHIRYMTLLLKSRGWHQVVDADQFTKPFSKQILSFQLREGMDDDGLVGEETFRKLHTARL